MVARFKYAGLDITGVRYDWIMSGRGTTNDVINKQRCIPGVVEWRERSVSLRLSAGEDKCRSRAYVNMIWHHGDDGEYSIFQVNNTTKTHCMLIIVIPIIVQLNVQSI